MVAGFARGSPLRALARGLRQLSSSITSSSGCVGFVADRTLVQHFAIEAALQLSFFLTSQTVDFPLKALLNEALRSDRVVSSTTLCARLVAHPKGLDPSTGCLDAHG